MHMDRAQLMPLAPAGTVIALATAVFVALADSVEEHDGLSGRDASLTADLVGHRTRTATSIARLLTFVGSEAVVGVLTLGLIVVLLKRRGLRPAIVATVAMGVSAVLTVGVKTVVGRSRPGAVDRLGAYDSTYSFPSGHTLNSAVFLGLVCLLLVPVLARRSARLAAYWTALVLALGIGGSRVYLGYHWTTDVLASWTIAAVLLGCVHVADRLLTSRNAQSGDMQVKPTRVEPRSPP